MHWLLSHGISILLKIVCRSFTRTVALLFTFCWIPFAWHRKHTFLCVLSIHISPIVRTLDHRYGCLRSIFVKQRENDVVAHDRLVREYSRIFQTTRTNYNGIGNQIRFIVTYNVSVSVGKRSRLIYIKPDCNSREWHFRSLLWWYNIRGDDE